MNNGGEEGATSDREALLELLRIKHGEANSFVGHVGRATAIYFAVTGALLKFALDANATPELFLALSLLGAVISLMLEACCLAAELYRRRLSTTIAAIYRRLKLDDYAEPILGVLYGTIIMAIVGMISLCYWLYLLFRARSTMG